MSAKWYLRYASPTDLLRISMLFVANYVLNVEDQLQEFK